MTINEVKENLNQYRIALRDLQAVFRYISDLHDRSTATGSLAPKPDKVIASLPSGARFEDIIIEGIDLQTIVTEETAKLDGIKADVLALIAHANSARGRLVLIEFYINGKTNSDIATTMHYELRAIYKIKRKAIRQIAGKL